MNNIKGVTNQWKLYIHVVCKEKERQSERERAYAVCHFDVIE